MTISIHFEGHSAAQIRAEMLALLGSTSLTAEPATPLVVDEAAFLGEQRDAGGKTQFDRVVEGAEAQTEIEASVPRERGKPSPGHARRTKAEIAEDDAFEATQTRVIPPTSEPVAAISTGEERVGPEDDAATAEQDAADEAAETAAAKATSATPEKLTLDDLRTASGDYTQRFGLPAAVEDVPKITGFKVMVDCPEDKIAEAIAKVHAAIAANPFKRDVVDGAAPASPKLATKEDVAAAVRRYALKYDGQDEDPKNMPCAMEDGPKVLALVLGKECALTDPATGKARAWKISDLPNDPVIYARAVAGIDEAATKNPFSRSPKSA